MSYQQKLRLATHRQIPEDSIHHSRRGDNLRNHKSRLYVDYSLTVLFVFDYVTPDFLRSNGSGTGSTQPREDN
jgi:hypothetical protein